MTAVVVFDAVLVVVVVTVVFDDVDAVELLFMLVIFDCLSTDDLIDCCFRF